MPLFLASRRCDTDSAAMDDLDAAAAVLAIDIEPESEEEAEAAGNPGVSGGDLAHPAHFASSMAASVTQSGGAARGDREDASQEVSGTAKKPFRTPYAQHLTQPDSTPCTHRSSPP